MMNKTGLIVFDFGNVLIELNIEVMVNAFKECIGIDYDVFNEGMPDIFKDFEKGLINEDEFLNGLRFIAQKSLSDESLISAWNSILGSVHSDKIALLKRLRLHYKTALLSNTNETHIREALSIIEKKYPVLDFEKDCFDYVFYSFKMKLRKPDIEIYKEVEAITGYKGKQILFIDDNLQNIQAARMLNWEVIHLQDIHSLESEIDAYFQSKS